MKRPGTLVGGAVLALALTQACEGSSAEAGSARGGTAGTSAAGAGGSERGGAFGRGGNSPTEGGAGSSSGSGGNSPAEGGAGSSSGGEVAAAGDGGTSESVGGHGGDAGAGEAGTPNFIEDAKRDIVDTTLSMDLKTQRGRATITLAPAETSGATFEVIALEDLSVSLDGEPLAFRVREKSNKVDVDVPPSTEPLSVVFEYAWGYGNGDGVSPAYTLTWPTVCGKVFPCHSEPSDGTTFHIELSNVPAGEQAIYADEILAPAPSYMGAWAIGDYQKVDLGETSAGTKVAVWHLPSGEADAMAGSAHLTQAFDWFEQHIGTYLFGNEVGAVAVDWPSIDYGGMEHHPRWHVALKSMADELVQVHEASHGWFGNGVRLRCWEDLVLSEGTASYLAARVLEEVGAVSASAAAWQKYENDLATRSSGSENHVAWPQTCRAMDPISIGVYSRSTYVKGALFYRALEQHIGRDLFDSALRTFYERFAGEAAGMQDMLDVVNEISGYDPTQCADKWLKTLQVPPVEPCE